MPELAETHALKKGDIVHVSADGLAGTDKTVHASILLVPVMVDLGAGDAVSASKANVWQPELQSGKMSSVQQAWSAHVPSDGNWSVHCEFDEGIVVHVDVERVSS
jgi:hypothetical protein